MKTSTKKTKAKVPPKAPDPLQIAADELRGVAQALKTAVDAPVPEAPPVTAPVVIDLDAVKKAIETAGNEYAKKHMRQPTEITLRGDIDILLHHSAHAFLFDYADINMTRERFMGMDVTVVSGGPEFVIREPRKQDEE